LRVTQPIDIKQFPLIGLAVRRQFCRPVVGVRIIRAAALADSLIRSVVEAFNGVWDLGISVLVGNAARSVPDPIDQASETRFLQHVK
jgi:hypothetical protein